jgi:hypothetical protein
MCQTYTALHVMNLEDTPCDALMLPMSLQHENQQ